MNDIQTGGSSAINEIEVDLISPNPEQPRRTFDEETLEELATSIRELGIIQPLSLRDAGDGTYRDHSRRASLARRETRGDCHGAGICAHGF